MISDKIQITDPEEAMDMIAEIAERLNELFQTETGEREIRQTMEQLRQWEEPTVQNKNE